MTSSGANRPAGRVHTVRVPVAFSERIEQWAVANDYVGPSGTVVWAEVLRHFLAVALDVLQNTGMDEQIRMAYFNGYSRGWGTTKHAVIAALNEGEGESHG